MTWIAPIYRASLFACASALFYLQTVIPPTSQPDPAPAQATPVPDIPKSIKRVPKLPPPILPNLILLDPAHGGIDAGAHLPGMSEADWTLAFVQRLQPMLTAKGFNVANSRDQSSDQAPPGTSTPSEDQRAEQANRQHPLACILLHATPAGHGVHIFTSALTPGAIALDPHAILPWNVAQASSLTNSLRLATDVATALNGIRVPLVLGRASVPPIDSLTCPAIAIELAPLAATGAGSLADPAYTGRVAEAIVNALVFWRGHTETEEAARRAAQPPVSSPASVKKPFPRTTTPIIRKDTPKAKPAGDLP